jgi:hypothetical protein
VGTVGSRLYTLEKVITHELPNVQISDRPVCESELPLTQQVKSRTFTPNVQRLLVPASEIVVEVWHREVGDEDVVL